MNKSNWFTHSNMIVISRSTLTILLTVLIFSLQPPGAAHAASFTAGAFAELVTAINTANGNGEADDITLTADIVLTSALPNIASDITINGAGFMLDGNNSFRVLNITGGTVILNNITITNGSATNGGGIFNNSTLTLNDSTVSSNHASSLGGGIADNTGAILTLNNSTISGNTASTGGGAISDNKSIQIINNSTIYNNSTTSTGGGGG